MRNILLIVLLLLIIKPGFSKGISHIELLAFEDIFLSCSKSDRVCYKMTPRFWSPFELLIA